MTGWKHLGITVVVGAFAAIGIICIVLIQRPTGIHRADPGQSHAIASLPKTATVTFGGGLLSNNAISGARSASETIKPASVAPQPDEEVKAPNAPDVSLTAQNVEPLRVAERRVEAAPRPKAKQNSHRTARRHWSRHYGHSHGERGEASRLMAIDLRQRGISGW